MLWLNNRHPKLVLPRICCQTMLWFLLFVPFLRALTPGSLIAAET